MVGVDPGAPAFIPVASIRDPVQVADLERPPVWRPPRTTDEPSNRGDGLVFAFRRGRAGGNVKVDYHYRVGAHAFLLLQQLDVRLFRPAKTEVFIAVAAYQLGRPILR